MDSEDFGAGTANEGSRHKIVVGIPAFNVERSIAKVVVHARAHCDEIIVCDDGSSDDTARIAEDLGCIVVRHVKNRGYGAAIRTLMDTARKEGADVLITVDGDGQHNPKEIENLVEPIAKGTADLVVGTRFGSPDAESIPRFRRIGIRAITKLVDKVSKQDISDAQSGLRAYSRLALASIRPGEQGMGASTEILL